MHYVESGAHDDIRTRANLGASRLAAKAVEAAVEASSARTSEADEEDEEGSFDGLEEAKDSFIQRHGLDRSDHLEEHHDDETEAALSRHQQWRRSKGPGSPIHSPRKAPPCDPAGSH